jgi:hypothetical protein
MTKKMSELRAELYKHFLNNIDEDNIEVQHHRPWTIVAFTTYTPEGDPEFVLSASKVCHPDKWDEEEGENKAVARGLAWLVKEYICPAVEIPVDEHEHTVSEAKIKLTLREAYHD